MRLRRILAKANNSEWNVGDDLRDSLLGYLITSRTFRSQNIHLHERTTFECIICSLSEGKRWEIEKAGIENSCSIPPIMHVSESFDAESQMNTIFRMNEQV
jgi:hypothetical protein